MCAALALYFPSRSALNFRGGLDIGPPFACYVCIVVKDNNLGGTISNSWGCLYGSLLASLVCFTLQSIVQDEQYSAEIALPLLLIFSFILNYVELHPLAKKFGLGVLALNFLTTNTQPAMQTWLLFANILVGIATGLVGNILPWPRLSSDLVDKRALFCAEAMSAVLNDITLTWRYATCPLIIPTYQHSSSSCYMRELKADNPLFPSSRSIWKLFKHVLLAVIAFKKKGSNMHWSSNHSHHKNHVYMRLEMIKYTSGIATILIQLTKEARFGPLRSIAIVRYDYFNFLMRDLLIVISIFENRLRDLRRHPEQHDPLFAFQSRPTFRAAVHRYNKCLGATLVEAALWLRSPKKTLSYSNISSMVQLRRARDELDEEYADARAEIYYNEDPDKSKQMTSFGAMNQNSFMFLYDACFLLIEQYWSTFQDPIESRDEEDNRVNRVSDTDTQMAHTLTMFRSIGKDLFLSQTHLFTLSRSGNLTTVIRQRLLQSLSVAVSMTGAGAYGFYTGRPQVFLAAFTIASISGGSVSGATTLTSVDRSIGTIVGSVFALIVAYILKQWGSNDFVQTNVFIWAVVVLWQLPCTFVRTLQSHSHLGVVSGFTAPVLLLIPNVVDTQAVDRIIDTYVGVGIYLIVDYIVAPVYSDDALLTDIRAVFKGIKVHFSEFVDVFRSHGAATSILSRESSLTESISHCKDLSVYASIIPLPWRPPPLEKRIVNELISGQEAAHRSIRVSSLLHNQYI